MLSLHSRERVSFRVPRLGLMAALFLLVAATPAFAQEDRLPIRTGKLLWEDAKHSKLSVTVSFRDVIDPEIQSKLTRGLPTTILYTAGLYATGNENPIGTAVQTCRVTWHVWEEAYRVEMTRSNSAVATSWTTTIEGVLRRCGETRRLPVLLLTPPKAGQAFSLRVRVLVNPIGDELLQKIKRWVSRPASTNSSAPGDAIFGTFTGFFMQHVGEAERIAVFGTLPTLPIEPVGDERP